jgi:hypothetical protein
VRHGTPIPPVSLPPQVAAVSSENRESDPRQPSSSAANVQIVAKVPFRVAWIGIEASAKVQGRLSCFVAGGSFLGKTRGTSSTRKQAGVALVHLLYWKGIDVYMFSPLM